MADWPPDARETVGAHDVFFWIVPARVEGTWSLKDGAGNAFHIELLQSFQRVTGTFAKDAQRTPLRNVELHGDALSFDFTDGAGAVHHVDTLVHDDVLAGAIGSASLTGKRAPSPRADAWATMAPLCDRFFHR